MSISSALSALADDVTAARAKITSKGGTVTPNGGTSQLVDDIDTIPSGGITPSGSVTITENGTYDVTQYAEAEVNVPIPEGYIVPTGSKTITSNGTHDVKAVESAVVDVPIPEGYVIPSGSVNINTNGTHDVGGKKSAIVNVPTGAARTSADLTASGGTVIVPAGLYSEAASKSVASGTQGTPTASKSAVSGNSITVTPSCTDTTGYISGTTKTGTGVTVSASELVSGNKAISANGTGIDVTNYKTVSVDVPAPSTQSKSATPSLSAQTISPDSGKLLSSVSVGAITKELLAQLDADFVAENIKKDVDLFGLIGALEGGGGGGGYETGTITFSDETTGVPYRISHNLGVIPSIIIYYPTTLFGPTEAPGSYKVIAAIATPEHQFGVYTSSASSYGRAYICSVAEDWTLRNASFLRGVNETSFQIGSWGVNDFKAWTYKWVAII